jgi:glucosamine--fructose-6-phosphate aminotransferase (isomerizing)
VDVLAAADRALVVSRGFNYATALEIALKLKETSGVSADGYSSADLLHGPIAIAGPQIPLIVIRPDGAMGAVIDASTDRLRAAGAEPWTIGGRELAGLDRDPHTAPIPISLPEPLTPLAYVIPGQLVAEAVACRRGLDPDAPPHLTKVTRTL